MLLPLTNNEWIKITTQLRSEDLKLPEVIKSSLHPHYVAQ
jgi:hypothetical protein